MTKSELKSSTAVLGLGPHFLLLVGLHRAPLWPWRGSSVARRGHGVRWSWRRGGAGSWPSRVLILNPQGCPCHHSVCWRQRQRGWNTCLRPHRKWPHRGCLAGVHTGHEKRGLPALTGTSQGDGRPVGHSGAVGGVGHRARQPIPDSSTAGGWKEFLLYP